MTPNGARFDEIVQVVRACPSGALSFAVDRREAREQVDAARSPEVSVSRDGPYRVTGGIPLVDENDAVVARNIGASPEHYSLCRCGHSQNKPFCSGMHWYVRFADPIVDGDHEWGSRLALENSQPGSRPPANMPVPRWWWVCDATPGSRVSALASTPAEPDASLPGPTDNVTFEAHVRPLFRHTDRQSMLFAFDLWAYPDVVRHAAEILSRLDNGSMPCDASWPRERVDVLRRWVEAGTPP